MWRQALLWIRSGLSVVFVLTIDLTLVATVWVVLIVFPLLSLAQVYLLTHRVSFLPFAAILIIAVASFVGSILSVRILIRLCSFEVHGRTTLRIVNRAGLLLLVLLLLAPIVAVVFSEAESTVDANTIAFPISGVVFCSGLWFGLKDCALAPVPLDSTRNVVFLRRFHSLADRSIIEVVRGGLPLGCRLLLLRAPRELLRLWDPIQLLFDGVNLRHPWHGVPLYIRSDGIRWVEDARQIIRSARVIVLDATQLSEALLTELSLVRELGGGQGLVLLSSRSRADAVSRELGVPLESIVVYRRSILRSVVRFAFAFMVIANGCVVFNLLFLIAVFIPLVFLAPDAARIGLAWIRGLWEAMDGNYIATFSLLGFPLYLWATWKLAWTARLDRASSRRIKSAIRIKLAGEGSG